MDLVEEASATATCSICSKSIPKKNLELHSLRCVKVDRGKGGQEIIPLKKDTKKKIQGKGGRKEKKTTEEEDVDALIAQFANDDSKCSFDRCKNSILTLGQICKFCRRRFCLKHGLAEIHGCGEAAKIDARRSLERNSGKTKQRPLNDVQKGLIKKKLNDKIVEMEKSRTGSNTKKK